MKLVTLKDLYLHELRDLYDTEKRVEESLAEMAETATSPELKQAFEDHLAETRNHVNRLDQVFEMLDEKPKRHKCKGIQGIIEEGEELMDEDAAPAVTDAALITSAQRVEHYEIAAYGAVRTYARRLGFEDQARLLQQTLDEEGQADKRLTALAESYVNEEANSAR
jgi:ferritin-like metal-binding protein YciE